MESSLLRGASLHGPQRRPRRPRAQSARERIRRENEPRRRKEGRPSLYLPHELDVGPRARNEDEVDRTLADNLVGDVEIAAAGVARLRRVHDESACASGRMQDGHHLVVEPPSWGEWAELCSRASRSTSRRCLSVSRRAPRCALDPWALPRHTAAGPSAASGARRPGAGLKAASGGRKVGGIAAWQPCRLPALLRQTRAGSARRQDERPSTGPG
jgi:hypothetical protein